MHEATVAPSGYISLSYPCSVEVKKNNKKTNLSPHPFVSLMKPDGWEVSWKIETQ